MVVVNNKN